MQNWFESAHCGNHGVVGLNHVINKKKGGGLAGVAQYYTAQYG